MYPTSLAASLYWAMQKHCSLIRLAITTHSHPVNAIHIIIHPCNVTSVTKIENQAKILWGEGGGVGRTPHQTTSGGIWPGLGTGAGGRHAMLSLVSRLPFLPSNLGMRLCYAHVNLHGHVPCSQLAVPRLGS